MRADIRALFALFTLSGFTGLIYESVWSHYLRLFLGSAAFAQSFVLAVFMGGMALGAWLASRWSARLRNALAAYGWIEALIGVAALVFHEAFVYLTQLSLERVIPGLGSPEAVELYKYSLCGALIVPQTVLLGMTFPLLSGAVIRRSPQESGHHLAMLYFTNSIGAAVGALAAVFLLIGWIGMPGAMRLAGALNLALAAAVLVLARRGEPAPPPAAPASGAAPANAALVRLLLAGAFVTGAASFIYEIAWIRMLSLVLGSSFQAFELMLSAFITGLALGGLWIRRRIDRMADPVRFLGVVQLLMGLAALATVFVYHYTFDWMAWALTVLQRSDAAYPLFNLFSDALAFAVMLPATFLAGMTLPLFTYLLLRGGRGERAIGQVYAANTLGAIAGVLVCMHLLLPGVGVKLSLVLGTALDMLLGAWILRQSLSPRRRGEAFAAVLAGLLAATGTARAHVLEPARLASGVYRYGKAVQQDTQILYYRDGKTASIAVSRGQNGAISIASNGKPDAAISLNPSVVPVGDESTMVLLAALPLLAKPEIKTVANIGFGSGLTAEVLLSHRAPQSVDTVEIEPAMVEGAHAFAPRVLRPFRDPRSHIHIEDAKSYFARHGLRYDAIIAEPSNPWVNGVAGLFTTEFYRDVKRYLAPGGVFVQWLQLYEFDDRLLASILAALGENFSAYEIYEANVRDIVVLAVADGSVPRPAALPAAEQPFLEHLQRMGISSIEDVTARRLGARDQLAALYAPLGAPVNSDFHPFVQLEASRTRFTSSVARALTEFAQAPIPVTQMLAGADVSFLRAPAPAFVPSYQLRAQSAALELADQLAGGAAVPLRSYEPPMLAAVYALKRSEALCGPHPDPAAIEQLHRAAEMTLARLPPNRLRALWVERRWLGCAADRLSPRLRQRLDLYAAIAARDAPAMVERASALLAQGPAEGGDDFGRFLLLAALVGARASGDAAGVASLWRRYGGILFPGGAPAYVIYVLSARPS